MNPVVTAPAFDIHLEVSTKFRVPALTADVAAAGFRIRQLWTDQPGELAVLLASVDRR